MVCGRNRSRASAYRGVVQARGTTRPAAERRRRGVPPVPRRGAGACGRRGEGVEGAGGCGAPPNRRPPGSRREM